MIIEEDGKVPDEGGEGKGCVFTTREEGSGSVYLEMHHWLGRLPKMTVVRAKARRCVW